MTRDNPDKAYMQDVLNGRAEPGPITSCPASELLGARLISIDGDTRTTVMEFTVGPHLHNGSGVVFGGFLMGMLDMVMAFTTLAFTEAEHASSIDLHTHFLRPARSGTLRGEGRVVRLGRRIIFAEAVLENEDGKEVARASTSIVA